MNRHNEDRIIIRLDGFVAELEREGFYIEEILDALDDYLQITDELIHR